MSDQRWRRIEEICHGALELETAERASFVRESCRATKRCVLKWSRCWPASAARLLIRRWGLGIGEDPGFVMQERT